MGIFSCQTVGLERRDSCGPIDAEAPDYDAVVNASALDAEMPVFKCVWF